MTKYLDSSSFSGPVASDSYRKGHEEIFGKEYWYKGKRCRVIKTWIDQAIIDGLGTWVGKAIIKYLISETIDEVSSSELVEVG